VLCCVPTVIVACMLVFFLSRLWPFVGREVRGLASSREPDTRGPAKIMNQLSSSLLSLSYSQQLTAGAMRCRAI